MADNTLLNPGTGGDTTRSIDKASVKTTVVTLDLGGSGAESLIAGSLPVTSATFATAAKQDSLLTELQLKADLTETQPVSLATVPINAAASTSAKQDTGNTSVASIDTKTPALGQALAVASVPVVLTAIQVAALTPPAAITGFALETGGNLATVATNSALQATAAKQDTGNSSLVSILAQLVALLPAQAASISGVVGPLMQAAVSDTPSSYLTDTIQPLSLTAEGRLRVSTVTADIDRMWQHTFADDPWGQSNSLWGAFPSSAQAVTPFVGAT